MTATQKFPYEVTKPNLIYAGIIALMLFIIGVHAFVTYYVYPNNDYRSFAIEVPARGGGDTYYTDPEEFRTVNYVVTAIFAAASFLTIILLARGKKEAAAFTISFCITTASIYGAIILGNAFYELWRGWWAVAGVLLGVFIGIAMQVFIVKAFEKVRPSDSINP